MSVFRRVDNLSEEETLCHKQISKVQESIKGKNSYFTIHAFWGLVGIIKSAMVLFQYDLYSIILISVI